MRHFLAVASHSTVQAAAESLHLNLTQSALTKSIARFESELGAARFERWRTERVRRVASLSNGIGEAGSGIRGAPRIQQAPHQGRGEEHV